MEPAELFNYLESNQPQIVEDAKKRLHQIFNITKDSWLLNGLFDYYIYSNSARSIEILVSVREPHDKYLFDRLCEALKNPGTKLQALTVLGHVLRRQPAWLFKITQHQLLKDLLKLLKTENDILPLLSALLVIVVLLPMIPALIGPYLQDIFDIFSRLAAWNCNPGKLGEEQLVHLQVAMYALFLRLYGMYPCNFLFYLRNHYRQGDNMPVFTHTVKPMLGTVKIHPHLVTASKDNETETARWKKMGHQDVIVECERFAIDVINTSNRDDLSCYTGGLRSRSSTMSATTGPSSAIDQQQLNVHLQQQLRYSTGAENKDFWSPTMHLHSSSPPPVPEVCTPASIPQTPNSQIPNSQNFVVSSSFPHQEGTSPPEAAIEATPETTPIKDPRITTRHLHHHHSTSAANVARALTSLNNPKWTGLSGASTGSTPSHSQPSSPMRKESSPFRFPTEGSAFELSAGKVGGGSAVNQKFLRIMHERSQVNESPTTITTPPITTRGKTPTSHQHGIPTSPLRVIPRHHYEQSGSSVPHSPVPLVDGPGASNIAASNMIREWSSVARPRPEKNGVPISIGGGSNTNTISTTTTATTEFVVQQSQEDQEVVEIVRQGEMQNKGRQLTSSSSITTTTSSSSATAMVISSRLCDSVLQDTIHHGGLDDPDYDPSNITEYCGEPHDLQQGSPCTSGGLHMPNSHSLQLFATRVHRLRYYSQCGPVHDSTTETSTGSSPGQRDILPTTIARVRRANSCPEMKKNYSSSNHGISHHHHHHHHHHHNVPESSINKGAALDESDELNIDSIATTLGAINLTSGEKPPQRSTSTQTLDLWPMPYEHLFLGIFPLLEMNTEVRPSPSPSPAPVISDKIVRFSPYEMLDKYIEQASYSYEHDGKRKVNSLENEIKNLKEQLGLVHLQLQYERHRREVHAVRNRRLLGESRNNKALDEHNSALKDQVMLLQKDIENLNCELVTKKDEFIHREKELQNVIKYWQDTCLKYENENKLLRGTNDTLQRDLVTQQKRTSDEQTLRQKTEAELFQIQADLAVALEKASHGESIRIELELTQRELLLAGELNQKYRDKLDEWPLIEHKHHESKLLADAYHEEIRMLKQQLDNRNVIIESQKTQLQELEHASQQRDELCASQKRMLIEIKDRYEEELNALESKYNTQRVINRTLEQQILELWQRIELATNVNRGSKAAHHSPDTSSCHEAGITDKTGGATAGGLSSPHSSSPLSASLASSEGSMAFLHTTSTQPSSTIAAGVDVREIKNLQVIIDQTNNDGAQAQPGPSVSEEATPDGNNPGFFYNQSD